MERYRLIVQREGKRVRLFTRNGHDSGDRFPLIIDAALRNGNSSFVIDGEAVLLGVDGRSYFEACIPASTTTKCSFMRSTCWSRMATIYACCH